MPPSWEPLEWDSEFFGFRVGRIDLAALGYDRAAIARAEGEACDDGVVCLYASLDPADYQATYTVQTYGYRFVEASARFDLHPDMEVAYPETDCHIRRGTVEDLSAMEEAVVRMAPWSRYAVDPRFGTEAAARMHRAWLERAARCDTGEYDLMVAENDDGIAAFVSRSSHPHPMVDSVGTTAPGSGAARALIEHARDWARPEVLWGGWAAARNVNSYRFVEHCGYRVAEVRYHYHRWLDDVAGRG